MLHLKNDNLRDFPGGPMVNLPSNAGNMDAIPGQGTKIPYAVGQLSLHATTREAQGPCLQSLSTLEPLLHNKRSP